MLSFCHVLNPPRYEWSKGMKNYEAKRGIGIFKKKPLPRKWKGLIYKFL
jgi:hypothetical protein